MVPNDGVNASERAFLKTLRIMEMDEGFVATTTKETSANRCMY